MTKTYLQSIAWAFEMQHRGEKEQRIKMKKEKPEICPSTQ